MSDRPVLRLGRVRRDGARLAFEAAPEAIFDARVGEPVEVAILYDFVEAGGMQEAFHVKLTAEAGGRALGTTERKITDTPGITDVEHGALILTVTFGAAGLVAGKYTVEAEYSQGAWSSRDPQPVEALVESGKFLVRVH